MPVYNIKYTDISAPPGPVIPVFFVVPSKLEKAMPKESRKEPIGPLPLLVDTGASHSCIDEEIPKRLGLKPIGTKKMSTASHESYEANVYHLRIIIAYPNGQLKLNYEGSFLGTKLKNQNIHGLLGRDFMKGMLITYNAIDNSLNICF